jgi:hypothetical protein
VVLDHRAMAKPYFAPHQSHRTKSCAAIVDVSPGNSPDGNAWLPLAKWHAQRTEETILILLVPIKTYDE